VSYDTRLLVREISARLAETPCTSLGQLSKDLCVSRRTIESVIKAVTGKTFRELQSHAMFVRVRRILESHPTVAIKELSFTVGYRSARSFARSIKRQSGMTPQQYRALIAEGTFAAKS
jgi:AraC-like DNA-binding protein